ncbi:hypothetical protein HK104_011376 [Borealophlyctis nickersoniae]|nr:hypothetical protein HK104_011376 [Borealophlyctis nickersoniae]
MSDPPTPPPSGILVVPVNGTSTTTVVDTATAEVLPGVNGVDHKPHPTDTARVEESPIPDPDDEEKLNVPYLSLWEVFKLFLTIHPPTPRGAQYFGFNAWGGPVAQIALLKDHLVLKQKWISVTRFNKVYAVYQILPGPEAAELCVYFGFLARGRVGALLGGLGFVLPGFCMMLLLSYVYTLIGLDNVYFNASFKALQPVVAAMVLRAVHKIADHSFIDTRTKKFNKYLFAFAILSALNSALHVNFLITLAGFGLIYTAIDRQKKVLALIMFLAMYGAYGAYVGVKGFPGKTSLGTGVAKSPEPGQLFGLGLLGGLLSFGGAYTAIPFVQQEAVVLGKWISQQQFLDGIALGNILPAPLVIFSTFVGFMGGKNSHPDNIGWAFLGGILMTIGMFIPCFAFIIIGHNVFERVVKNTAVSAFLDGVSGSVVGIIAITALDLLRASVSTNLSDPRLAPLPNVNQNAISAVMYVVTLGVLYRFRKRSTALVMVLGAAVAGQFLFLVE